MFVNVIPDKIIRLLNANNDFAVVIHISIELI